MYIILHPVKNVLGKLLAKTSSTSNEWVARKYENVVRMLLHCAKVGQDEKHTFR
jgi:hypothetical protein